jgi:hypothetical protein
VRDCLVCFVVACLLFAAAEDWCVFPCVFAPTVADCRELLLLLTPMGENAGTYDEESSLVTDRSSGDSPCVVCVLLCVWVPLCVCWFMSMMAAADGGGGMVVGGGGTGDIRREARYCSWVNVFAACECAV